MLIKVPVVVLTTAGKEDVPTEDLHRVHQVVTTETDPLVAVVAMIVQKDQEAVQDQEVLQDREVQADQSALRQHLKEEEAQAQHLTKEVQENPGETEDNFVVKF